MAVGTLSPCAESTAETSGEQAATLLPHLPSVGVSPLARAVSPIVAAATVATFSGLLIPIATPAAAIAAGLQ